MLNRLKTATAAAALLTGTLAGPVLAQDAIQPGAPVSGRLGSGDAVLSSGEFVDTFDYRGRRGERLTIRMTSGDMDAYVLVRGHGLSEDNDDAPGAGTDAELTVTLPADGVYQISATSYAAKTSGSYQLSLRSSSDGGGPQDTPAVRPAERHAIALGQSQSGRLENGDPLLNSGEFYDLWTLNGRRGQQLDLRMSSTEFDPYLSISGPGDLSSFNDDDPDGGTNARLLVTLPEDGTYRIAATSYEGGERGTYQLSVLEGAGATQTTRPPAVPQAEQASASGRIDIGQAVSGALSSGDETLNSGEYVDTYRFEGRRGQRVRAELTSSAFDAYVILRAPSGDQTDNDDADDSTDSRLDMILPETGEYEVQVTSFQPGETGSYRFSVETGQEPPRQAAAAGGARIHAVMVGVSDYDGVANDLDNTDQDALKLAEQLQRDGSLNEASVTLINAEATVQSVRDAFAQVAATAGPDDTFLFFFSGHGDQHPTDEGALEPDGKGEAIVLRDGQIDDVEMGRLFDSLNTRLAILVLDACYSGGFARNVVDRPGVMALFSSEEDLTSAVADKFEAGGYLSHFLREGLSGAADGDGDRLVTAGELSSYLRRQFRVAVEDVESTTQDGQRNYQNLVIDRGGVQIDDVIVRLPANAQGG